MDSDGTGIQNPSWAKTTCFFCLLHLYAAFCKFIMERFDIKTFGSKADSHIKSVFIQICLSIGQVDKDAKAVCAECPYRNNAT